MNAVDFDRMDLNLLRVFLAIWDARSLTGAGERLHLTQPAVSHALRRLRDLFEDPLYVRASHAMVPTHAAARLEEPMRRAMGIIQRAFQEHGAFDPAQARRIFRVAMSDVSEFVLLPPLLSALARSAPGVRIESVRVDPGAIAAQLRAGEVDLALGYLPGLDEACVSQLLGQDCFVCLVRAGHPRARRRLTAAGFSELRFVYAALGATGHRMVEQWLDAHGIQRTIALRLAHFTIAPEIVRQTDLAVIFPRSMALRVNHAGHFRLLPLPFEAPTIEVMVHSHAHFASDLGIAWLRELLLSQRGAMGKAAFDDDEAGGARRPAR